MLLSIIYVDVLVYRRVVKYVAKHYICTCTSAQESSKEFSVLQMDVVSKCSDIIHLYTKGHNFFYQIQQHFLMHSLQVIHSLLAYETVLKRTRVCITHHRIWRCIALLLKIFSILVILLPNLPWAFMPNTLQYEVWLVHVKSMQRELLLHTKITVLLWTRWIWFSNISLTCNSITVEFPSPLLLVLHFFFCLCCVCDV